MLLKGIKDIFHQELDAVYAKEEVDTFFYRCIEHYLNLERFVLVLQPNFTLTKEEESPLFKALARLKQEEPLQYILGVAHFMDLEFEVNRDVLIPRPETEELVEWILSDYHLKQESDLKILDIGTGSGCIAIALAKNLPKAKVYALDVSREALELAKENAMSNGVEVTCIQNDILVPDLQSGLELNFDIIVSNPPYVRELEKSQIKKNVKDHEPHLALFVPDQNALLFYKAIVDFAQKSLGKNGTVYLEINQYLGEETKQLLETHTFVEVELRKDLYGNDRMLKGILGK